MHSQYKHISFNMFTKLPNNTSEPCSVAFCMCTMWLLYAADGAIANSATASYMSNLECRTSKWLSGCQLLSFELQQGCLRYVNVPDHGQIYKVNGSKIQSLAHQVKVVKLYINKIIATSHSFMCGNVMYLFQKNEEHSSNDTASRPTASMRLLYLSHPQQVS